MKQVFCQSAHLLFDCPFSSSTVDVVSKIRLFIFQRVLYNDTPHRDFFSCLRESNQEFVSRSGWVYHSRVQICVPFPDIVVLPYWGDRLNNRIYVQKTLFDIIDRFFLCLHLQFLSFLKSILILKPLSII